MNASRRTTTPAHPSRRKVPAPVRTSTVFMGRTDFISTLLRLIGVELYKIRRRPMASIMLAISILSVVAVFAIIAVSSIVLLHSADAQAQQLGSSFSGALRLPLSLNVAVEITEFVGMLLMIILAGTIVGGEYTHGTLRLLLTRGPTRTQFILMKIGALLVCTFVGFLLTLLIGLIVSLLLNPLTGIPQPLAFLTGAWIMHAILYALAAMLALFIYAMLALCLATLGRSTAAGIAGALAWALLEPVLSNALFIIGHVSPGPIGRFLSAFPDYLIGNNTGALLENQGHYLFNSTPATLTDLHALLVLLVYLAIFIGIAWYVIQQRDITN